MTSEHTTGITTGLTPFCDCGWRGVPQVNAAAAARECWRHHLTQPTPAALIGKG